MACSAVGVGVVSSLGLYRWPLKLLAEWASQEGGRVVQASDPVCIRRDASFWQKLNGSMFVGLSCYPRRLTFPQPFSYALRDLVVSLLGFKIRHNRRRVSVVLVFGLQRCSVSQCRRSCPWLV